MAATTLSRATITDDSGSGTDGTILNAAWFSTAIYDKVDALFTGASLVLEKSNSGASVAHTVANTANAADSFAYHEASVGGASAGDPHTRYTINGVLQWNVGIDNSENDQFTIWSDPISDNKRRLAIATTGHLILPENTGNPGTTDVAADAAVAVYTKADIFVIAYNNGGTMTYITIPLDGSTTTWSHSTSAP